MFFKDPPRLILASTSLYRRALLERLQIPFDSVPPDVDEMRLDGEAPETLVARLARAKADAVAVRFPGAVVVGSDQAAIRNDQVLGKPLTVERCTQQLRESSGREVDFLTAVHMIDGRSQRREQHIDRTTVLFRTLSTDEIVRYIEQSNPDLFNRLLELLASDSATIAALGASIAALTMHQLAVRRETGRSAQPEVGPSTSKRGRDR